MNDLSSSSTDRCVLCLDQKRSPVQIQCGHSFCFDCLDIYKSYQKYAWANRCPICRGLLKEKKRAVKRKYSSTTNTSSGNPTSNPTATVTSDNQTESNEQIVILEEFMAWAAGYANTSETQNTNIAPDNEGLYHTTEYYDDLPALTEEEVPQYADHDEYYGDDNIDFNDVYSYDDDNVHYDDDDDHDYDDDDDHDYDDDYYDSDETYDNDVVDFPTDSDDDENDYYYQFSEDVTSEYYSSTIDVAESMVAQSSLQQHQQQPAQQQQDPEFMIRDCNNNMDIPSFLDLNIEWEEVVIID